MLNPLRQVLNEAADRFDFRTPFDSVKQLKTSAPTSILSPSPR